MQKGENVSKYILQFLMLELLLITPSQMGSFGLHQFAFGSSCKIPSLPLQKLFITLDTLDAILDV